MIRHHIMKDLMAVSIAASVAALSHAGGTIMTVRGPIDSKELGMTLEHEHILVDFIGAEETGYHRWDKNEVVKHVLPHLLEIKKLGYKSLFECTPAFLGRDPALLKMLSEKTDLHLITNTGYYGARKNKFIPKNRQSRTVDELAAIWVKEFEDGIEDTGIKPGFIKIAVDTEAQLSTMHEKLLRAACRAHLKTGLTIACHTGRTPVVFQMEKILKEEGVAPSALIWVHATYDTPENQIKAAKLGLWVSIDNITTRPVHTDSYVHKLTTLKKAGHLDRVLISHDAGYFNPDEPNKDNFTPYTAISNLLIPKLKEAGFTQADIDQLLVHNPRRAFEIQIKKSN